MSGRNSSVKVPRQEGMLKIVIVGQRSMRGESGKRNWRDKHGPEYVGFWGYSKNLEIYLKSRQNVKSRGMIWSIHYCNIRHFLFRKLDLQHLVCLALPSIFFFAQGVNYLKLISFSGFGKLEFWFYWWKADTEWTVWGKV